MIKLNEISKTEWEKSWQGGYRTTYFQSPKWFEIWAELQGGSARAYEVFDDEDSSLGIFPVLTTSSYGITRTASSCAGTFGGMLQSESSCNKLTSKQIRSLADNFPNLSWRIPPECAPDPSPDFIKPDYTHRLDLTQGLEAINEQWEKGKSGIARKVRKARNNGVSVFPAKYPEEWKEYHELYLQNTQRWSPPPSVIYPFPLFDALRSTEKTYAKLWLAYSADDQLVAGALCLYSPQSCVYWNGATSESHQELRPMNLLISTIIKDAIKNQLKFFDFNPSGGVAGIERFKESFGATKAPAPVFDSRSRFINAAGKLKSTLSRIRVKVSGDG